MPPLTIVHLAPRWLVALKPPGLLTVDPPKSAARAGEDTLVKRLSREGHPEVLAVHRLDRETSGLVLLARDPAMREELMAMFKAKAIRKIYLAIVQGHLQRPEGSFRFPIKDLGADAVISRDGQPAETRYRVLEVLGPASLVEIELPTGRHNQARIHFAHVGHPLIGERKYARGKDATLRHKRAALHAHRLSFTPPQASDAVSFESPLPIDLENLIAKCRALMSP